MIWASQPVVVRSSFLPERVVAAVAMIVLFSAIHSTTTQMMPMASVTDHTDTISSSNNYSSVEAAEEAHAESVVSVNPFNESLIESEDDTARSDVNNLLGSYDHEIGQVRLNDAALATISAKTRLSVNLTVETQSDSLRIDVRRVVLTWADIDGDDKCWFDLIAISVINDDNNASDAKRAAKTTINDNFFADEDGRYAGGLFAGGLILLIENALKDGADGEEDDIQGKRLVLNLTMQTLDDDRAWRIEMRNAVLRWAEVQTKRWLFRGEKKTDVSVVDRKMEKKFERDFMGVLLEL